MSSQRVYRAVLRHIARYGVPPSVREVGAAVNAKSTSQVVARLDDLVARGKLVKRQRKYLPQQVVTAARVVAQQML